MAGHSKFKNIQHRKGAQDKKRAKIFTKLVRDITSAAQYGTDPAANPRLRGAIIAARAQNLPRERIERALKSDANEVNNYVEMRYEGFASGGIAIIVEAMTDNKNRTASEVRAAFSKHGGNLGETGSVSFMFDHVGMITYPASIGSAESVLDAAIEAGASDVESDAESHIIYTEVSSFSDTLEFLTNKYGAAEEAHIGWKPQNIVIIDDKERAEKLLKMIDAMEDSDDVQNVFGNYDFSEEVSKELAQG
jgi:YebC/PmpR family DNA-binding regulatory protein